MSARQPFRLFADFTGADPRFRTPVAASDCLGLMCHRPECPRCFPAAKARPLAEYHEDMGPVLWWRFPIQEAPWCGAPDDSDWPFGEVAVHFTPLPAVPVLA